MADLLCCNTGALTDALWRPALTVGRALPSIAYDSTSHFSYIPTTPSYSSTFSGSDVTAYGVVTFLRWGTYQTTGTLQVYLRNVTDDINTLVAEVTADKLPPLISNPIYLEFSSPYTFVSGKTYSLALAFSTASVLYQNSSSYPFRIFVGNDALTAPAAGDHFFIIPHYLANGSVQHFALTHGSQTETVFGYLFLGGSCSLTLPTDASTTLRLGSRLVMGSTATFQLGSAEQPLQSQLTAEIDLASGATILGGAAFRLYGAPLFSSSWALLAATAQQNATTITVDRDTGWRTGDTLVIAPTGIVAGETEVRTITAVSDRQYTLNSALTYQHLGDLPPFQAEVINLERNLLLGPRSAGSYPTMKVESSTDVVLSWVKYRYLSGMGGVGLYPVNNYTYSPSQLLITYAAAYYCQKFVNLSYQYYYVNNQNNTLQITYNVGYGSGSGIVPSIKIDNNRWSMVISHNCLLNDSTTSTNPILWYGNKAEVEVSHNRVAGFTGGICDDNGAVNPLSQRIEGNVVHSCRYYGFETGWPYTITKDAQGQALYPNVIWHCGFERIDGTVVNAGVLVSYKYGGTIEGLRLWGNGGYDGWGNLIIFARTMISLHDIQAGSSPYYPSNSGIGVHPNYYYAQNIATYVAVTCCCPAITSCRLGEYTTASRPHVLGDIVFYYPTGGEIVLEDSVLASPTPIVGRACSWPLIKFKMTTPTAWSEG